MLNNYKIQPGIGWSEDLQVSLHEGDGNLWYPQVNPGWYYINGREDYLYAKEGWYDTTVPSGYVAALSVQGSGDFSASVVMGPLIIDGPFFRYQRLTANLSAFNPSIPSVYIPASGASGSLMYFNVPGELVMTTGNDGTDMIAVPGLSYLQQRNYYYWDFVNRLFWINRDPADPNRNETLYLTWMKDRPDLYQDEILLVDSDGLIRTMFSGVTSPIITIPGMGQTSGTAVGNVITPGLSLSQNTRVSVRYLVDGSFCISDSASSPGTANLSTYRSVSEPVTIRWETARWGAPVDLQPLGSTSQQGIYDGPRAPIQLNTLSTGISEGFLYLSNQRDAAERLASLEINTSSYYISPSMGETLRVTVTALDSNNIPLRGIPIQTSISNGSYQSSLIPLQTSTYGETDFNGCQYFSWVTSPNIQVGTYVIGASALTSTGMTITASETVKTIVPMILTDAINTVKAVMYLNPSVNPNGLMNLYAYLVTQLGVPVVSPMTINIRCQRGLLYLPSSVGASGMVNGVQSLNISAGNQSMTALCQYYPVNGDIITATPQSVVNGMTYSFVSTPLIVNLS